VSALILDSGALVAVDRDDRAMVARLRAAQRHGLELRSNAMVIAQVWRDRHGRQAKLARLLRAVDVRTVTQQDGRDAGALQSAAGTADPIDATVVLLAAPGDRILTSDAGDLTRLAEAAGNRPVIVGGYVVSPVSSSGRSSQAPGGHMTGPAT
jgi:hypothetical protein